MKNAHPNDPIDSLAEGYEQMLEHAVKDFYNAEVKTGHTLQEVVHRASDKMIKLGGLSEDDAGEIARFLKRDLSDAANYLSESGRKLEDWLGFETTLLESKILDILLKIADDTTVKLIQLKENADYASHYRTGELMGHGSLACDNCSEVLHFHRAAKIPPCPKCHTTNFHRYSQ